MVTLIATVYAIHCCSTTPDGSVMLAVDQGLDVWLCGWLWIAAFVLRGFRRQVLVGFVGLYSVGILTSSLRIEIPMTRVTLWMIDLTAQFGVVLWWIWVVKAEAEA